MTRRIIVVDIPPQAGVSADDWHVLVESTAEWQTGILRLARLGGSTGSISATVSIVYTPLTVNTADGPVVVTTTVSPGEVSLAGNGDIGDAEPGTVAVVNFANLQTMAYVNVSVLPDEVFESPDEVVVVCIEHGSATFEDPTSACGVMRVVDDGDAGVVGLRIVKPAGSTVAPALTGAPSK